MITTKDLLHLLTHQYHDGRYLNGHPNIVQHLMYDVEHTDDDYYIQLLDGPEHARIWSSRSKYEQSLRAQTVEVRATEQVQSSPIVDELRRAVEQGDYMRIIELKKMMRDAGIDYDKKEFSVRRIVTERGDAPDRVG